MRYSIRCARSCAASPETVYDLIADPERWPQWLSSVRTAEWEKPGEVRRIVVSGLTMREEVLVSDRPHHHAYTILSGIPVSDHRADVRITRRPRGCLITWTATFRGRIPGTGSLLWLMLRVSMPTMVNALAQGAESRT